MHITRMLQMSLFFWVVNWTVYRFGNVYNFVLHFHSVSEKVTQYEDYITIITIWDDILYGYIKMDSLYYRYILYTILLYHEMLGYNYMAILDLSVSYSLDWLYAIYYIRPSDAIWLYDICYIENLHMQANNVLYTLWYIERKFYYNFLTICYTSLSHLSGEHWFPSP